MRVLLGVEGDFFEDMVARSRGVPVPEFFGFAGVQNHPGNIKRSVFWFGDNLMATEALVAPGGELAEGHRGFGSAGEIDNLLRRRELSLGEDLFEEQ